MVRKVHLSELHYHVVKVEAGAKTTDRDIGCRCCGALFACREGQLVVRYFLLREAAESR